MCRYIVKVEKLPTPATQLRSVGLPQIQRKKNIETVQKIYTHENEYYSHSNEYIIPGAISIAKWRGAEYLVDGQHRLAAYIKLSDDYPERKLLVSVDYYILEDNSNDLQYNPLELLYEQVNTCTPNDITKFGVDKYKIMQQIERNFNSTFGKYISKNNRPNSPNINIQNIIQMMSDKQLVEKTGLSGDAIWEHIRELNARYSRCSDAQFKAWNIDTKYLAKIAASENRLYLGLWRAGEWIDRLIDIINGHKFECLHHYSITWRPKILKSLRRQVWAKRGCTLLEQSCFVCQEEIKIDSFHCGHIVAVARGGPTKLDNLEAICEECNKDMGTMDMREYIALKNDNAS